jgi:predicted SnoaL-like aldol condensation-catalyzing enzyme
MTPVTENVLDPVLESNKRTVLAFYQAGLNEKDFAAARALIGDSYTQHNPRIADGVEGFRAFVDQIRQDFPQLRAEVKRLVAEGDLVMAHVHGVRVPGQPGTAIVDVFRLRDGRIVEHWDVMQPVPDESANPNGMF